MRAVGVGAKDADKGTAGMAGTLGERFWAWLHETFPERQIYIRSDGRVQFFTFGPTLQATLASLTLIFLGWVAFATVNVIFKDRIIAAKDHRYQQMQSAYENRVADLQLSYDELNGALVAAEDRFKATADELRAIWGPLLANAGSYEVSGDLITIHPLVAKFPVVMKAGATEVYRFHIEGSTLTLKQVRNARGITVDSAPTFKFVRVE